MVSYHETKKPTFLPGFTWLVLGEDPAARSHRVEQFTALWLRLWYKSLRPELQRVELDRKSLETVATTLQEDLLAKRRQSENPQESEAPHQGALLEAVGSGDVLLTMKVFAFC